MVEGAYRFIRDAAGHDDFPPRLLADIIPDLRRAVSLPAGQYQLVFQRALLLQALKGPDQTQGIFTSMQLADKEDKLISPKPNVFRRAARSSGEGAFSKMGSSPG